MAIKFAWDIMKRIAQQADYFPYMPQSSSVDEPFEIRTGGNMEISSAAALETVWHGIFGIEARLDGSLSISPNYNPELGSASLTDYRFRGHSIDIRMDAKDYEVKMDGKTVSKKRHGQATNLSL